MQPPRASLRIGRASFPPLTTLLLCSDHGAGHAITLANPGLPGIVLHYTSWKQICDDIDDARIYGGIHFRFDQEAGAHQGRLVGRYLLRQQLRSPHDAGEGGDDE
jgi:hypothetical protein